MDPAKLLAITGCGRCGQPEDAHKFGVATGQDDLAVFAALGGPCTQYVVSDQAVITQKWLAITDNRAPGRSPDGSIGKRLPLHKACGHRHPRGSCPYRAGQSGPGPDTARQGAAKAREALGLTRQDEAEAS